MSRITLDYTNCLASSIGATHGLTDAEIDTLVAKFPKHHENIEEQRANGESGFFDLPYQDPKLVKDLIKTHKGKWDDLVVIGLGGATISPANLCGALLPRQWNLLPAKARKGSPRIHFMDNADPAAIDDLMQVCDPKKTLFQVVSRSGQTAETIGITAWLIDQLRKKCGKGAPSEHLMVATHQEKSGLAEIAKEEKLTVIPVPANLSDRYNVLGAACLFPAGMCGIDIDRLLAGGKEMDERCRHDKAMQNPAYMHSLIHYLLTRKRRKTIHAMMAFSNRLNCVVDWYSHLLSVSLGKMLNKKGKAVHVGPGPASCCGPNGNYGQMQLYQEGPFDKVLTFITAKDHGRELEIPKLYPKIEPAAYLGGVKLTDLMDRAYIGAAHIITTSGRPNMTLVAENVCEETVAGLCYLLMLSTAMSAELYGIDAFDQPGVDLNKQAVYAQSGRAGFEDKARTMTEYRNRPRKTC